MMTSTYPLIFGVIRLDALLMIVSGVFYLICALLLWRSEKNDKSELVNALLAFLVYQTVSMFFMGLNMYTMNPIYAKIAALAVLLGSAYMLKFPFSVFSAWTRKILFMLVLILSIAIFAWFMQTVARQMSLFNFVLWYDLVVNGLVVGGTIVVFGLRNSDRVFKMKALGGGGGVLSCCLIANATILGGAILTSSIFQFLAPIMILAALFIGKKKTQETTTETVTA